MADFLELEVRNTVGSKTTLEPKPGFDEFEILQVGIEESNVDDTVVAIYGIGTGPEGSGVVGQHFGEGFGVIGVARKGRTAGVNGRHLDPNGLGHGVRGEGGIGVFGTSSTAGHAAVFGDHKGEGTGVVGDTAGSDSINTFGVLGRHKGPNGGDGVRGEGTPGVFGINKRNFFGGAGSSGGPTEFDAGVGGFSEGGPGIFGSGAIGGQFRGTRVQLNLFPGPTAGRPSAGFHPKGDIYMDSEAALFVCIADGTPGTWVRVATEPA
jgi:hypothetical protein